MPDLQEWQLEVDGLLIGGGTPYVLTGLTVDGPEATVQDQRRPRADGILFGRDTVTGTKLTVELLVQAADAAAALAAESALATVWSGDGVRFTPGATQTLRYRMPGFATRRVTGRCREFAVSTRKNLVFGKLPVTARFQCRDHLFYDDAEQLERLDQVAVTSSGLVEPLVEPLSTEPFGERPGFVINTGEAATPVRVTFHGPSTSPSLLLVATGEVIKLDASIVAGDFVEVDTLAKTVLRGGVANVAGSLTRSSRFWQLPPGTSELRYQAIDPTGSSFVEVRWRDANLSL